MFRKNLRRTFIQWCYIKWPVAKVATGQNREKNLGGTFWGAKGASGAISEAPKAPRGAVGMWKSKQPLQFFKIKNAASMCIKMIQARLRIKINSPPLSKFNPTPDRKYWIMKGHYLAEIVSKSKVVIDRIKKEEVEYDCKIFD